MGFLGLCLTGEGTWGGELQPASDNESSVSSKEPTEAVMYRMGFGLGTGRFVAWPAHGQVPLHELDALGPLQTQADGITTAKS